MELEKTFIIGFFIGLICMSIVCVISLRNDKELDKLIKEGYCIINDNVNYETMAYYATIENKVICVDKKGVLHSLRPELQGKK